MMVMNRQMNLPAMQRIMMEFEKQSEKMDMKEEMMSDTMDDVFEEEDEKEEVMYSLKLQNIYFNRQMRLSIKSWMILA
jgi:division protein CdvB (Snf7/Vps24/ESCRT-III family)